MYRQLGLDVGVMNFHSLEVLVLSDYIHSGFGIVSKVSFSTLLRIMGKLKTPLMLKTWTLYISLSSDLSTSSLFRFSYTFFDLGFCSVC